VQEVTAGLSARVAGAVPTAGAGSTATAGPGPAELLATVEQALGDLERRVRLPASFVVPGETRLSAEIHQARSVCRRAERSCVSAGRVYTEAGADALVPVLNRLSDYLFVLALFAAGGSGSTASV